MTARSLLPVLLALSAMGMPHASVPRAVDRETTPKPYVERLPHQGKKERSQRLRQMSRPGRNYARR